METTKATRTANVVPVTEAPTKKDFDHRNKFTAKEAAAMLGRTLVRVWQLVNKDLINARFTINETTGRRENIVVLKSGVIQALKLSRGVEALRFSK